MISLDDPAAVRLCLADALELIGTMLANKGVAPYYRPACNKLLRATSISALRVYAPELAEQDNRRLLRGA